MSVPLELCVSVWTSLRVCVYLYGLEVCEQQGLAALLGLHGVSLLGQPGLHQLQHVDLLTQVLSMTLKEGGRGHI